VGLAENLEDELGHVRGLISTMDRSAVDQADALRKEEKAARSRSAVALRRQAMTALAKARLQPPKNKTPDAFDAFLGESRRLDRIEKAVVALDPAQAGIKQELLTRMARSYVAEVLGVAPFAKIEQYVRVIQSLLESLRREGLDPSPVLAENRAIIEQRLGEHVKQLARPGPAQPPGAPAVNGEAYVAYRQGFNGSLPDGETAGLAALEDLLSGARAKEAPSFLPTRLRDELASAELAAVSSRVAFLVTWWNQLIGTLPPADQVKERAAAERAFDKLVQSRFPLLWIKEGERVRLRGTLASMLEQPGEVGESARDLDRALNKLGEAFGGYSKRVLDARAGA
ncbi:MAG TPA: AAA family ATPase, partial [Myxococcaceae bacterium]|nr:AAA family ATPase [Myxococcaceae bacterium]